ncbi:MAG: hypothetical protein QNJ90_03360, partial [Planctomycetota bacterium]|nr:hypothetical protein [Planctomycetota bacterium]
AAADGKDTAARLAWRPPLALADARVLRVALRAPVGTTVALAQRDGAEPRATVERAGGTSEPGVAVVELPLEGGWFERLPEGRLELRLTVPAGAAEPTTTTTTTRRRKSVRAWFDGISLVLGGVSTPQAKSVPGAPAGG